MWIFTTAQGLHCIKQKKGTPNPMGTSPTLQGMFNQDFLGLSCSAKCFTPDKAQTVLPHFYLSCPIQGGGRICSLPAFARGSSTPLHFSHSTTLLGVPPIPTESSPREIPDTEWVQKTAGKDLTLPDKPKSFYSMQQRQLNFNAVPLHTADFSNSHQLFGASHRKIQWDSLSPKYIIFSPLSYSVVSFHFSPVLVDSSKRK